MKFKGDISHCLLIPMSCLESFNEVTLFFYTCYIEIIFSKPTCLIFSVDV